jgi:ACS family pantothenate transporter-like MFS transporter
VYQINLFPTAAQACGLVTTLLYSWLSDGLGGKRWQLLCVPAVRRYWPSFCMREVVELIETDNFQIINLIGMIILAVGPNYGATFLGYMLNAASWGYWPVLYVRNQPTPF